MVEVKEVKPTVTGKFKVNALGDLTISAYKKSLFLDLGNAIDRQ